MRQHVASHQQALLKAMTNDQGLAVPSSDSPPSLPDSVA